MAAGQGRGVDSFLPRDLFTIQVNGASVIDFTEPGALERVELATVDIESDDWTPCQTVGGVAHFLGLQGILAPSSTGEGVVLAVFEGKLGTDQLVVVRSQALAPLLAES
jgi:RES domain-containing protein